MEQEIPTRLSLFWQKNGWLGLIVVAAALLLFGIGAIVDAMEEREQNSAIETDGVVAMLRVIKAGQRLSEANRGEQTGYDVYVDFTVDGLEYRSSQGIAEEDFVQLTEGQDIVVRYLPDDPYRIWVAPDWDESRSDFRFFGSILLIFGLFLVWGPWVVAGNELKKMRR